MKKQTNPNLLIYGLIMIYKLAPSRPTKFSEVWLGGMGATVLIWLGELLFLVCAANFARFNLLYGALGGIAAALLWVYLSGCVGVFGICVCAAQAEVRREANNNSARFNSGTLDTEPCHLATTKP